MEVEADCAEKKEEVMRNFVMDEHACDVVLRQYYYCTLLMVDRIHRASMKQEGILDRKKLVGIDRSLTMMGE